jgi:predicted metal-dependent hydrolase
VGRDGQEFRVRRHPGARRITLRVQEDELVVTAPPHVSDRELRAVVAARGRWVA